MNVRRRLQADIARLAQTEAELRARFVTDPGALVLADHHRAMRLDAERELQRLDDHDAAGCTGETLPLF